jgi:hypothetical protein
MTAYAQAQHYRKGEGIQTDAKNLLSGSMYFLDLVKEGELWKIKKWDMKLTWLQGDASIVMGGS